MKQSSSTRKPSRVGWHSTDELEIEMRKLRAQTEPMMIWDVDVEGPFYGRFAVDTKRRENPYFVDIRSLINRDNTCNCPDYRKNGLGTCKHIEGVLLKLAHRKKAAFSVAAGEGSPFVEVHLARGPECKVRIDWPRRQLTGIKKTLSPFFSAEGILLGDPVDAVPAMKSVIEKFKNRHVVRFSSDLDEMVEDRRRRRERQKARAAFEQDVRDGKRTMDLVKMPLHSYQKEGMLHLAFGERVMLADDMGLGKTVQAIAACELLRQLRGIDRVLVIAPTSLKTEWEEQIARFTSLPVTLVVGPRKTRVEIYQSHTFFTVCNYEQAVIDWQYINENLEPDVVILDEAQRIKNWQTKTADTIKRIVSPLAFVLTGTPIENKIDEIYSIVEFLDPAIFGSLFRFNRDFYHLDERGKPAGYKNLEELQRRIKPVMLRRRKNDVETQLPARTVKQFFVGMEKEQQVRYDEYEGKAAKLLHVARKRPLLSPEFKKLQMFLACMRMLCDSTYILDEELKQAPKLPELSSIIDEILSEKTNKVIIFSEWERMLMLVLEMLTKTGIDCAWHTGSVPQRKRRDEINRFKNDPDCRIFLSTDAGATGLNLQTANYVINMDLPWNPAKLEQRIARAWRKHQTRPVTVINLICENSIEQRMLDTLSSKQALADGILDGVGDLTNLKMPGGRAAMIERLSSLMGVSAEAGTAASAPVAVPDVEPAEMVRQDLAARLGARLVTANVLESQDRTKTVVVAVDGRIDDVKAIVEQSRSVTRADVDVKVLDRDAMALIDDLIKQGLLQPTSLGASFWGSARRVDDVDAEKVRRKKEALIFTSEAERKSRMAALLAGGGFHAESLSALRTAIDTAARAVVTVNGLVPPDGELPLVLIDEQVVRAARLPATALGQIAAIREACEQTGSQGSLHDLYEAGQSLLTKILGYVTG